MRNLNLYPEFKIWSEIHTLPAWIIKRWQSFRLRKLLEVTGTIPFYAEKLAEHGIPAENILKIGIAELPLVEKRDFLSRKNTDYVSNIAPHTVWTSTSGSSGVPFSFILKTLPQPIWYHDVLAYRNILWEESGTAIAKKKIQRIRMAPSRHPLRPLIHVTEFFKNPDEAIEKIRQFDPHIIDTYPSIILEIARRVDTSKVPLSSAPLQVITYGEMLTEGVRSSIQETLSADVYNRYGMEEFGSVGIECRYKNGFHLNSETFIMEVLDEAYEPLPRGYKGQIVITDLYNFNMPFIRYLTGDYGYIAAEKCPCGLETELFHIEGRYGVNIKTPERTVHHFEIAACFNELGRFVQQYQIAVLGENRIEIRIVPAVAWNTKVESSVRIELAKLFNPRTHIALRLVDSTDRLVSGKSKIVSLEHS